MPDQRRQEIIREAIRRSGPRYRQAARAAQDCRSEEGVIIGLIDGIIAQSRIVARYLTLAGPDVSPDVIEALTDIRADEDVAVVVAGGSGA